jgi:hypothetical protein
MIGRSELRRSTLPQRTLRTAAVVFAMAVLVHGVDHLRRGTGAVTEVVLGAGTTQALLGAVAVVLVFRRHRLAPALAAGVGIASAVGFAAVHLLPQWSSSFSDPYTGSLVAPHVNAFSWLSALFEIGADLAFGLAALQVLRTRAAVAA